MVGEKIEEWKKKAGWKREVEEVVVGGKGTRKMEKVSMVEKREEERRKRGSETEMKRREEEVAQKEEKVKKMRVGNGIERGRNLEDQGPCR